MFNKPYILVQDFFKMRLEIRNLWWFDIFKMAVIGFVTSHSPNVCVWWGGGGGGGEGGRRKGGGGGAKFPIVFEFFQLLYKNRKEGLSNHYRPRSDAAERSI